MVVVTSLIRGESIKTAPLLPLPITHSIIRFNSLINEPQPWHSGPHKCHQNICTLATLRGRHTLCVACHPSLTLGRVFCLLLCSRRNKRLQVINVHSFSLQSYGNTNEGG